MNPSAGDVSSSPTGFVPGRLHARRLRDVYRSAGWPCLDAVEVELLAAGLLARVTVDTGHDKLRLTDAGIGFLAQAFERNRQAMSAHDALVDRVAQNLLRDGRIVWTGLSLRARLPALSVAVAADEEVAAPGRWKICRPDVFSIRSTTVPGYLEPVVHEIKVSRADLLADLQSSDKRDSYLHVGGQCWYVLGRDNRGRPIADADEVPASCGVMIAGADGRLELARFAPRRAVPDLPFDLWMSLARATPLPALAWLAADDPNQQLLVEQGGPPPA